MQDLFATQEVFQIGEQSFLYRGALLGLEQPILTLINMIKQQAPFRHMYTPGGYRMSVAMTWCGALGPQSNQWHASYQLHRKRGTQPWPPIPKLFLKLGEQYAAKSGFVHFKPNAVLLNRYDSDAKLSLHQDKDGDAAWPIVSLSFGATGRFMWGGWQRNDPKKRFLLENGDVLVWGGVDRLRFHGVDRIYPQDPTSPFYPYRYNITLRVYS